MVESHNPATQTDSRVLVNDVRLPVSDVDIYLRKEGGTDLGRYAEVQFASPWNEQDYAGAFDGLTPTDQDSFDTVRIDLLDSATEDYTIAFRGIVTGVANAPTGGDRIWSFRAEGPAQLLNRIPASKTFDGANAKAHLDYVVNTLDERLPFGVSLLNTAEGSVNPQPKKPGYDLGEILDYMEETDLGIPTPKTFQFGKHTLANVLDYVDQKAGYFSWFVPTEYGVGLVATKHPTANTHKGHYLNGGLGIVANDAYAELNPVNTMVVSSPARASRENVLPFNEGEPSKERLTIKAVHEPLLERSGGAELHADTHRLSDAHTKEEVINEAKRLLKQKIDQTTAGDMEALLKGDITPYDVVSALPTCQENAATNMTPLDYEVSRVHHRVRADEVSTTELTVGIQTDMDDIKIADSWETNT